MITTFPTKEEGGSATIVKVSKVVKLRVAAGKATPAASGVDFGAGER